MSQTEFPIVARFSKKAVFHYPKICFPKILIRKEGLNPNAQMFRTIFFLFLFMNFFLIQYLRCTSAKIVLLKIISYSHMEMENNEHSHFFIIFAVFYIYIYFLKVVYFLMSADKNVQKRGFTPSMVIKIRPSDIFKFSWADITQKIKRCHTAWLHDIDFGSS